MTEASGDTTQPPAGASNTENRIPQSRFNEVIQERNALQAQMAELQVKFDAMQRGQLEAQQRYQELAEQYKQELDVVKPVAARVTDMEVALQETVAARIERLPEDMRPLVPSFDDPRQTLHWLNQNENRLLRPLAPEMDAGRRGDSAPDAVQLDQIETYIQKVSGLSREEWVKHKKRSQDQEGQDVEFLDRLRAMNRQE